MLKWWACIKKQKKIDNVYDTCLVVFTSIANSLVFFPRLGMSYAKMISEKGGKTTAEEYLLLWQEGRVQ